MTTTTKKLSLLMGTTSMAVLSATLAFSGMAHAQDAAAAAAAAADETVVVVTGQRAALKSAQKIKKDAETIVDSAVATDIGALPDRSVTEALQRIVGVTIERTDTNRDPARLSGEGGGVAIRGLNYVRTELNGRDVFAAKNGRSLGFSDVSADLMAGVDVYKNTTADQIEGAIGGTVNLRTRLPFDSKQRIMALSFDSTSGDLRKERFNSYSATYADRWNTGAGEFGLLLNYSLNEQGTRSDSFTTDKYTATGNVQIPNTLAYKSLEWDQKRTAYAGALQWRPNDKWEFTLQGISTEATPLSMENTFSINPDTTPDPVLHPDYKYANGASGPWVGGTVSGSPTMIARYGIDTKKTTDVSLNAKFHPTDSLTITADLQQVKSTQKSSSLMVATVNNQNTISNVDLSGDTPVMDFTDIGALDVATNNFYQAAMDHYENSEATLKAARIDAVYDFKSNWLRSFKVGVRTSDKKSITRETGWNWGAISADGAWGAPAYNITNDGKGDVNAGQVSDGGLNGGTEYFSLDNFMHGAFSPKLNSGWFATRDFLTNPATSGKLAAAALDFNWCGGCGGGFVPFNGNYEAVDTGRADNPQSGINIQREKTTAGYAVLRFGFDDVFNGAHSLDGNIGVRVVKTETDNGKSFFSAPSYGDLYKPIDPLQTNAAELAKIAKAQAMAIGGRVDGAASSSDYNDVLPSVNLRLRWSDMLQFRLALSKAIVRPNLVDLQGYTFLAVDTQSTPDGNFLNKITGFSGRGGNPDLKPLEANQLDLTAEYYFAPTGSVTLAVFKKDLKNYFYGATQPETYTIGGQTQAFDVLRVRNGDKGKLSGFELAYQQFYDNLPGFWSGFGVQANYTYVKTKGGANPVTNINDPTIVTNAAATNLPLEGLSPKSYNFAVMYEKYGIEARVAYNWRDRYLMTTSAANINLPVWMNAYGQIDTSLLYRVSDKFKFGVQITNLDRSRLTTQVGYPDGLANYSWVESDRRVAIVLRGQF